MGVYIVSDFCCHIYVDAIILGIIIYMFVYIYIQTRDNMDIDKDILIVL